MTNKDAAADCVEEMSAKKPETQGVGDFVWGKRV